MENNDELDEEINLLDYFNIIYKHKIIVLTIIIISVAATTVISFLLPKIYQANAVIMPANQTKDRGGISTIAMQFGISSPSASNVSEIISLLKSNILMEKVITNNNLVNVFLKKEELKEMSAEAKSANAIRYLKSIYKVNNNTREGIIELSAEFQDPKTAADILTFILTELTEYMSSEAKRVAETNRQYLESLITKNADPLIRQKIYSLIAQQIETSMMSEVKENFAFKVIDPPRTPDRKIKPKIRQNIMLSFVTSLFAGIFIAFFVEYVRKLKSSGSTEPAGINDFYITDKEKTHE